jgi:hypothetical protein
LLPAIYRALDTDQLNSHGPLREIVNRIGWSAATLRRSIDRMWEDQSIETCDDWVIPYIGELLATNLVANLDARGQRLDVAKTIHYRRRKGTLAVLEEIAFDITGWNAKLVEFFRRLGRTRHGLDPSIGMASFAKPEVAELQHAEGLVGLLSGTGIGGFADLRDRAGARESGTAFDEFFHTADFRPGRGRTGWYGIPKLGVFLWRLVSFEVPPTDPVPSSQCPGQFTFDPTGREIPLFAVTARNFGDTWTSPKEWQLPTPITARVLEPALGDRPEYPLYATSDSNTNTVVRHSLGVFRITAGGTELIEASEFTALPVDLSPGTFSAPQGSAPRPTHVIDPARGLVARGFTGAERLRVTYAYGFSSTIGAGPYDRRLGRAAPPTPDPQAHRSGGNALTWLAAIPESGTVTLDDSLTYSDLDTVVIKGALTFCAANEQRPIIRIAPGPGRSAEREFQGTSGSCLVLDGLFWSGADLVLSGEFDCVTITCCTLDPGSAARPRADSVGSAPVPFFAVAADGRDLVPCRLWIEGTVRKLTVARSITGPIRTRGKGEIATLEITDSIVQAIPTDQSHAASVPFSASIPQQPADIALGVSDGDVILSRSTVIGPIAVHRLHASDCILRDRAQVDDTQHGCVRFTAWAEGSRLPRQYESVRVTPGASLFVSTDFGQPGYCQLLPTVDLAILLAPESAPGAVPTIASGAENGSEMGAFARDMNPIKQRGLLIKYQEYMPAGLVPVLVFVT